MKSAYWIEKANEALGNPKATVLAEKIGISDATLSMHKSGKAHTLNDENCVKIAEICNISAAKIMLDQHAERQKKPEIRAIWEKIASTAAIFLMVIFMNTATAPRAEAAAKIIGSSEFSPIIIIGSLVRWFTRFINMLLHPRQLPTA